MRQLPGMLAATFSIINLASPADAHHSHPYFYDQCRTITVEGRVERVEFKNPHTWIVVRLDDGTVYTVDWAGLRGLTNNGIIGPAKEALVFDARVRVTGNPIRTTAQIREHFPDFKSEVNPNTIDPLSIRRVDDTFNWALSSHPDCNRKSRAAPKS